MEPTALDLGVIRFLAPLQAKPFWVDAINILSQNAIVTGFLFIVPLFLFWQSSDSARRWAAQRLIVTVVLGTILGALGSLLLRHFFGWLPPAVNPASREFYNPIFSDNTNRNSFPSDSAMLYSATALGVVYWNRLVGFGLLAWLLIFVEPAKVFVGGHFPTDIVVGLLLGFFSVWLSRFLLSKTTVVEKLAVAHSLLFQIVLFLWLFEIGNEYRDFTSLLRGLIHIRRHL